MVAGNPNAIVLGIGANVGSFNPGYDVGVDGIEFNDTTWNFEIPPPMPSTKDDCKNGGWETYGVFKNQGDCVSFVATGGQVTRRPTRWSSTGGPYGALRRSHSVYATSDFEAWRSRGMRTTFDASPSFSSPVITQPPGSIAASSFFMPWNAEVGNAWWLLCQLSPNEIRLSSQTFRDSSAALEVPPAPEVADRVDRERHVVQQEDADRAAPEQRGQRALPGADDQVAEQCRHEQ